MYFYWTLIGTKVSGIALRHHVEVRWLWTTEQIGEILATYHSLDPGVGAMGTLCVHVIRRFFVFSLCF